MGLSATEDGLTLGIFTQIIQFQREDGLIAKLKQPLQKIEVDLTVPRIKPKEQEGEAASPGDQHDLGKLQQPEVELSEDDLAKREEQLKKWQEYQEKLYAPVDERVDACFITRSAHYSSMIKSTFIGCE